MPIVVDAEVCRLSQQEFGAVAYDVMQCIFQVHHDLGRFFDEAVYRDALAHCLPNAHKEVSIKVRFDGFCKEYFIDLLIARGAIFELKTTDNLSSRHQSQLINYLLLAELGHGKLVNLRTESVQHRFVNTSLSFADRRQFVVDVSAWKVTEEPHRKLPSSFEAVVREWGTGLERRLYEEAVIHLLGGMETVLGQVPVVLSGQPVRSQPVLWAGRDTIVRVTALDSASLTKQEEHLRRFVDHTQVAALQWINVGTSQLTFKTLQPNR
jgi:GxxExxY protein